MKLKFDKRAFVKVMERWKGQSYKLFLDVGKGDLR